MSRAIPASLLVHNCTLKKQSRLDRNRNPIYEHTILKQVRIGGTFKSIRGTYGETQFDALMLLIDEQNTVSIRECGWRSSRKEATRRKRRY